MFSLKDGVGKYRVAVEGGAFEQAQGMGLPRWILACLAVVMGFLLAPTPVEAQHEACAVSVVYLIFHGLVAPSLHRS